MDWQVLYERLSSESTEFRELNDVQFAQLLAATSGRGKGPRLSLVQWRDGVVTKEVAAFRWCKELASFNEIIREQRKQAAASAAVVLPKATEAVELDYVGASVILAVLTEKFTDHAALTQYLKLHPHIRTQKPGSQRKQIHAGDLLRQLASDAHAGFEQLDKDDIVARTEREKQKSLRKQK